MVLACGRYYSQTLYLILSCLWAGPAYGPVVFNDRTLTADCDSFPHAHGRICFFVKRFLKPYSPTTLPHYLTL